MSVTVISAALYAQLDAHMAGHTHSCDRPGCSKRRPYFRSSIYTYRLASRHGGRTMLSTRWREEPSIYVSAAHALGYETEGERGACFSNSHLTDGWEGRHIRCRLGGSPSLRLILSYSTTLFCCLFLFSWSSDGGGDGIARWGTCMYANSNRAPSCRDVFFSPGCCLWVVMM